MTAEEISQKIKFTDIKKPINFKRNIMQGVLYCKAQAKNKKWYPISVFGTVYIPDLYNNTIIEYKRNALRDIIKEFITKRIGIKSFHGRFQFQNFELI